MGFYYKLVALWDFFKENYMCCLWDKTKFTKSLNSQLIINIVHVVCNFLVLNMFYKGKNHQDNMSV